MHEHHQVAALIEKIVAFAKAHHLSKITELTVVMGDALGFDEGSVQLYFETLGAGTLLEGAAIHFKHIPAKLLCSSCNQTFIQIKSNLYCPTCGQQGVPTTAGKEFDFEIESSNP